jgi:hypothetical protein
MKPGALLWREVDCSPDRSRALAGRRPLSYISAVSKGTVGDVPVTTRSKAVTFLYSSPTALLGEAATLIFATANPVPLRHSALSALVTEAAFVFPTAKLIPLRALSALIGKSAALIARTLARGLATAMILLVLA